MICQATLLAVALFAASPTNPAATARTFVDLMVSGKVAEAGKLAAGSPGAKLQKDLEMRQRSMFVARSPAKRIEFGEALFSAEEGSTALVLFSRIWTVDGSAAGTMKKKDDAAMAEYFPANQLQAAKKVIRWEGSRYFNVAAVWLVREGGSWKVDVAERKHAGMPAFRAQMMKKFGANLLRYANEDMAEPGCADERDEAGICHPGERNEPAASDSKGGCVLEDGQPCDPSNCYDNSGDSPVPCKKGQPGCITFEGEGCVVK